MTVGASKAERTITRQPALAPSPQPRPAPTARALIVRNVGKGGPFWMPIWGPDRTPIDSLWATGEIRSVGIATRTSLREADGRKTEGVTVLSKPGNAGGGRGPCLRRACNGVDGERDW